MAELADPDHLEGRQWAAIALVFLLVLMAACLAILPAMAGGSGRGLLPVSLRAQGWADYGADPLGTSRPPLELAIIGDVLRDLNPQATDIEPRLTAIVAQLLTPVATDPQNEEDPPTRTGTTAVGSDTPAASTSSSPTAPATVSLTASASTTATERPTEPPSTATNTPKAATATPLPASPTPSLTSSPPSATPTADLCAQFSLTNFRRDGQKAIYDLNNESAAGASIESLTLVWPGDNRELVKIELDGDAIWDQIDESPPTSISGGWKSGVSRTVESGASVPLVFEFGEEAGSGGYNLGIGLDNGCSVFD